MSNPILGTPLRTGVLVIDKISSSYYAAEIASSYPPTKFAAEIRRRWDNLDVLVFVSKAEKSLTVSTRLLSTNVNKKIKSKTPVIPDTVVNTIVTKVESLLDRIWGLFSFPPPVKLIILLHVCYQIYPSLTLYILLKLYDIIPSTRLFPRYNLCLIKILGLLLNSRSFKFKRRLPNTYT